MSFSDVEFFLYSLAVTNIEKWRVSVHYEKNPEISRIPGSLRHVKG